MEDLTTLFSSADVVINCTGLGNYALSVTTTGVLDQMVAHLGSRTQELLYEGTVNIIGEILSVEKKVECYEMLTFLNVSLL